MNTHVNKHIYNFCVLQNPTHIFLMQFQHLVGFPSLVPSLALSFSNCKTAVYSAISVSVQFSSNETDLQENAAKLNWKLYGS